MTAAVLFFTILLALELFALFRLHKFDSMGVAIDVVLLFVLMQRMQGKYNCILTEKSLIFDKTAYFGKKHYDVPLSSIIGIYHYKPELIGMIHFRHSARLHSALDARDVWTIAYTQHNKNGKSENSRIFFKPSTQFLKELNKYLPGKITEENKQAILSDINKAD